MKKLATWVLAIVFTLSFALPQGTAFADSNSVKLVVDGVEVGGYEQAFISHEQVLIPVENLFNEAGFNVTNAEGKVSATNSYLTVDFKASASTIEVDGKKVDTEFPLTLQNGGNYITSDFLATLEGFKVEVSEDQKTVNVTTNRVDVATFLAKTATIDLNSSSLNVSLESLLPTTADTAQIGFIQLDTIKEPKSSYKHIVSPSGNVEEYSTTEGDYKKFGDVWVKAAPVTTVEATKLVPAEKVDATKEEVKPEDAKEVTEAVAPTVPLQLDSLATLALLQKYTKGINIFEYKDAYVLTQKLTATEAAELQVALTELLSGEKAEATEEATNEEVKTEETTVEAAEKVEAKEEAKTEETVEVTKDVTTETEKVEATEEETTEEATEDVKEEVKEEVTEEAKTVLVVITFNNFNSVKTITVPADVIKNAISEEVFKAQLAEAAKKAEEVKK